MNRIRAAVVICLMLAAAAPSTVHAASRRAKPVRSIYSSETCAYQFAYPSNWKVERDDDEDECSVSIAPADVETRLAENDVDVWTIHLSLDPGLFLRAAMDAGFDFSEGRWVVEGFDFFNGDATIFHEAPWWGVRGASSVGCSHRMGGNAGFCQRVAVVAQSGNAHTGDARILKLTGFRQSRQTLDLILQTFRFDPIGK
jgi:hypothetical protein